MAVNLLAAAATAAAAVAILILVPLPTFTCLSINVDNNQLPATDLGSFWTQQLPGVDIPPVLLARKSPLGSLQVQQFHQGLDDGSLFSHASEFCERANLFCNKPTGVIMMRQYGYGSIAGYSDSKNEDNRFFPFFQLREGEHLNLPFIDDPVSKYAFLPRTLAEKISPLSKNSLPELKRYFHVSEGSNMSQMMDFVVDWCSKEQTGDEISKCSTSIEDMLEFVVEKMGKNVQLLSQPDVKSDESVRLVTVNEAGLSQRYPVVACHSLPFPVGIYYCHYLRHTRGFRVKVYSEMDGKETVRPVLCHFPQVEDNYKRVSQQSSAAAAAACHFLPGSHIAWMPK